MKCDKMPLGGIYILDSLHHHIRRPPGAQKDLRLDVMERHERTKKKMLITQESMGRESRRQQCKY